MNFLISWSLQLLVAVIVIAILFVIGYFVFSSELRAAMLARAETRLQVKIVDGVINLAQSNNIAFNTQDSSSDNNYLPIVRSYNQAGGGEFSYSFWFFKTGDYNAAAEHPGDTVDTSSSSVDAGLKKTDLVLLLKGKKAVQSVPTLCSTTTHTVIKPDVLIKCPLIKFDETTDRLTVEFNLTSDNGFVSDGLLEQSQDYCSSHSLTVNQSKAHKVTLTGFNNAEFSAKWVNVAVVFRDSNPAVSTLVSNQVQVLIYINGNVEFDKTIKGKRSSIASLNQNNDFLYVAPQLNLPPVTTTDANGVVTTSTDKTVIMSDTSIPTGTTVKLGDVFYFNYAITADQAKGLYNSGITKKSGVPAALPTAAIGADPYALSSGSSKNMDAIFNP